MRSLLMLLACLFPATALLPVAGLRAQSVQPLIAEYQGVHAAGSFEVTNTSLQSMAVVLEPRSFTLDENGVGHFTALAQDMLLKLSTTSLQLGPRESATIFYDLHANNAPSWMTVYASFTPIQKSDGIRVRIMLPHTIYLYQKQSLRSENIRIDETRFDAATQQVLCRMTNISTALGRVEQVELRGTHHDPVVGSGFPLLPGQSRTVAVDWKELEAPQQMILQFANFEKKAQVSGAQGQ